MKPFMHFLLHFSVGLHILFKTFTRSWRCLSLRRLSGYVFRDSSHPLLFRGQGFRGEVKGRGKPHAGALSVSLACCLFSGLSWALSVWPPVCGRPELEPPAYQHTLPLRPFPDAQGLPANSNYTSMLWNHVYACVTNVGKTESYKCWFDPAVVNTKAPNVY